MRGAVWGRPSTPRGNVERVLRPPLPGPYERLRARCWAVEDWWDVHVRYRELHRRLDAVREDLNKRGLGYVALAAYTAGLPRRIDSEPTDDSARGSNRAPEEGGYGAEAATEAFAREYAAFQDFPS